MITRILRSSGTRIPILFVFRVILSMFPVVSSQPSVLILLLIILKRCVLKSLIDVGDTVTIKGKIIEVDGSLLRILTEEDQDPFWVLTSRVTEVIPKPWEPKIGDQVWWVPFDGV